jgi:hypothetical protein
LKAPGFNHYTYKVNRTVSTFASKWVNLWCRYALVAVSVSRDMMISLAEKAELFMERKDGRTMRFRRQDVHSFKQYSPTRLFDPSTAGAYHLLTLVHAFKSLISAVFLS